MTPTVLADLVHATAQDVLRTHGLDAAAVPAETTVRRPPDPRHGDYAADVALRVAQRAGVGASELAGWLAGALAATDGIEAAEVAGPGFVNLRLAPSARAAVIGEVLRAGDSTPAADSSSPASEASQAAVRSARHLHARLAMLLRHAADLAVQPDATRAAELLTSPAETDLMRAVTDLVSGQYPWTGELKRLTEAYDTFDLARTALPMGDEAATPPHAARVALVAATRQALANALRALGVGVPDRL